MSIQWGCKGYEKEDKPCVARYADCIHNGNLAYPKVRVNSARNSQTLVFGIMKPRQLGLSDEGTDELQFPG